MARMGRWWGFGLPVLLLACGDEPLPPGPEGALTIRLESAHGVYYHAPGDHVDVAAQEAYYEWLLPRVGLEPDEPLVFFKYRDRAHMRALTGEDANGWAEIGTYRFHSIWGWDNHECVHALVSATLGLAPALVNEGFAVAHQTLPVLGITEPDWGGTHIDTLAARFEREGSIPSLETLLRSRDFFQHDTEITYPMAGSFVKSLVERHGYEPLKALFRSSGFEDGPAELRADFREAFGEEIEEAWSLWKSGLAG